MINNKTRNKVKLRLTKDELEEIIKQLYSQCEYVGACIDIASCISDSIEKKFQELNDKWYVYALNSLDNVSINVLITLYNDQSRELSLYNILNYLYIQKNLDTFIVADFREDFNKIITDYNEKYDKYREILITRRNNWQIHISPLIFDKEKFNERITMNTSEVFYLYEFASRTCQNLYKMLTNEELQPHLTDHDKYQNQIEKFIGLLDANGDLI